MIVLLPPPSQSHSPSSAQTWRVFIRVEELFILVPILLNLKGNLEMNLAARFSTSANIGELDLRTTRQVLVRGNLALLQVQALLVSAFAGLLAFALGMLSRHGVVTTSSPLTQEQLELRGSYFEAAMVLCVSMLAASLSSGLLGSFMTSLVILSRRFLVNPDNVATPIAAVLGDLLTLTILGLVSAAFARVMGTLVSTAVVALLLAAVAFNIWLTYRNAYVRELLLVGWTPLLLAMLIASGAGVVLESLVDEYDGFALIAPVVTAIAGATGAILVSRMTTALHSGTKQSTQFTPVMLALLGLSLPLLLLFIVICAVTAQAPINLFAFFAFAISFVVLVSSKLFNSALPSSELCLTLASPGPMLARDRVCAHALAVEEGLRPRRLLSAVAHVRRRCHWRSPARRRVPTHDADEGRSSRRRCWHGRACHSRDRYRDGHELDAGGGCSDCHSVAAQETLCIE